MQKTAEQIPLTGGGWRRQTRDMPLVSVIMPCCNAEKTLEAAVESVVLQTYPHWELLLLDDGSADGTAAIAGRLAQKDARIHFYRNPRNMGAAGTRNRGIELAAGEWIAFLDSDDLWRSEKLEKQLRKAEEQNVPMVYASYALFTAAVGDGTDYIAPAQVGYDALLRENVIGCSTVMLHREFLGEHRFSPAFYHEDYALWLELLRGGCRAAGCTEVLADWRVSETSRSFNKWRAAGNRWRIYRNAEHLSVPRACRAFAAYAYRGIRKHKRI